MEKRAIMETLDKIAEQIKPMLSAPEEERILTYRVIDSLLLPLEGEAHRMSETFAVDKIEELKVHLIAIARLDDPDVHSDEQHIAWALKVVEEMRRRWE